jgi:hypothetical protein
LALGYARNESPKQAKAKVVQLARLLPKKVNTAFFSLRDAKKVTLAQIFRLPTLTQRNLLVQRYNEPIKQK